MEENYFYLTITGNNDKYNANQLNEKLNMFQNEAFNIGDEISNGNIANRMFIRTGNMTYSGNFSPLKNKFTIGSLLSLPKDLEFTLNLVTHGCSERSCYGHSIDQEMMGYLALLNANVMFKGQYHHKNIEFDYPFIEKTERYEVNTIETSASFNISSNLYTVEDISNLLGMEANDRSFSVNDVHGNDKRIRRFTSWNYKTALENEHDIEVHLATLISQLYAIKDSVLNIGNDIDIDYSMKLTIEIPDEYYFQISKDMIRKMAEMKALINLDVYFKSDY